MTGRRKSGPAAKARAGQRPRTGHYDVVTADSETVKAAAEALARAEAALRIAQTTQSITDHEVRAGVIKDRKADVVAAREAVVATRERIRFEQAPRRLVEDLRARYPLPEVEQPEPVEGEEPAEAPLPDLSRWEFMPALACLLAKCAGDDSMSEREWIEWIIGTEAEDFLDGWDSDDRGELYEVLTEVQRRRPNADLPKG